MEERRLSVVQAVPALEQGGVERGTLEVSAELVRRGHRSIVVSAGGRLVEELVGAGGEHIEWPIGVKSPLTLRWARRLRTLLEEQDIDILHARSRAPAWVCVAAMRGRRAGRRTRFVTTMHGVHSVSAYSAVMTRGERVIAVSETIRSHILEQYPKTDAKKIVLIHRGVDPAEFPFGHRASAEWAEAFAAQFPQTAGKRLVALPGRLTRLKGHEDFIRMIRLLRERDPSVCGLIVGGEDPKRLAYAQEVRREAASLGEGAVVFTGARRDMRDVLSHADVVVSLSTQPESFGRTVLEALSLGTPVVGYAHGGVGEVLGELLPEGRVALGDVEAAAERAARFLGEPPAMRPNTAFTRQAMLDKTIALYHALARERGAVDQVSR